MNPRIKQATPLDNYKILIIFDNNETKIFDTTPYLEYGIFKELKNKQYFNSLSISNGTITWPHEQDFCPDTLYLESK